MIDQATVERIIETAKIEEVLSDFISLKKSGSNLKGVCPFHQEKTPSLMVSPAKGIFKCFGCGKGGNAINFVMEHERITYPEALRWVAKKYNIEIHEKAETEEEIEKRNIRESLYIANEYAVKYYSENLIQSTEGKSAGLSYFRQRGFRDDIIKLFQLGYAQIQNDTFYKTAITNSYKPEILEKAGLVKNYNGKYLDMFHSRVIFPIHNVSGRVVGFTGRVLGNAADANGPKYLNTAETEIFTKGRVLYGLHLAKKAITQKNNVILVEGNTDVISMFQAGIENVIAGSGTALTLDQITLIKRFTKNILLIYDNDNAGLNAAMKNADLLLEEGFSVFIVILPQGDDPDSFVKNKTQAEIEKYLESTQQDFIFFKLNHLKSQAGKDPAKIASVVSKIIFSIALISDSITRSIYIKQCSNALQIEEALLYTELHKKIIANNSQEQPEHKQALQSALPTTLPRVPAYVDEIFSEQTERELLRLLINFGNYELFFDNEGKEIKISVALFIINELQNDDLEFKNLIYRKAFEILYHQLEKSSYIDAKALVNSPEEEINELAANLLSSPYTLSKIFRRRGILTQPEDNNLTLIVPKTILSYKLKVLEQALKHKREQLKQVQELQLPEDEMMALLSEINTLSKILKQIAGMVKWVVTR